MTRVETLRQWVTEHKVCWEVSPLVEMDPHPPEPSRRVQVGLELQLFARHTGGAKPSPGCPECATVYDKLRAIALFALPKEQRPSRHELSPFDASFHLRPESQWAPEVQLTIRIIHRENYFEAIDDCEKRCSEEIQEQLRGLGAQRKAWSGVPGAGRGAGGGRAAA